MLYFPRKIDLFLTVGKGGGIIFSLSLVFYKTFTPTVIVQGFKPREIFSPPFFYILSDWIEVGKKFLNQISHCFDLKKF